MFIAEVFEIDSYCKVPKFLPRRKWTELYIAMCIRRLATKKNKSYE
jgi:hypothetical protein